MAKKRASRSRSRGYSRSARSAGSNRRGSGNARRKSGGGSRRSGQVVRVVLEQAAPSLISRPDLSQMTMAVRQPRKASF